MPKETCELSKDEAQTLNIDELLKFGEGVAVKLQSADAEIGKLRLAIEKLENDKVALVVKRVDSENEVGRLELVLRHRGEGKKDLK